LMLELTVTEGVTLSLLSIWQLSFRLVISVSF